MDLRCLKRSTQGRILEALLGPARVAHHVSRTLHAQHAIAVGFERRNVRCACAMGFGECVQRPRAVCIPAIDMFLRCVSLLLNIPATYSVCPYTGYASYKARSRTGQWESTDISRTVWLEKICLCCARSEFRKVHRVTLRSCTARTL